MSAELADRLLPSSSAWPAGLLGSHRAQSSGYRGARTCLLSLCEHRDAVRDILTTESSIDHAVRRLRGLRAQQVGRTTAFDMAVRAGQLLHVPALEPASAHLHGSTGPAVGFRMIWGFDPNAERQQAARAEAILRLWTTNWHDVADQLGTRWPWPPLSPGDFENVLCIYQDQRLYWRFGNPEDRDLQYSVVLARTGRSQPIQITHS